MHSPARATRDRSSRVALITCDLFPQLWDDDFPLRDALIDRGVAAEAVRWDDPAADWSAYDLAVLRSPWDYVPRRDAFVAWAHSVPRLFNPADVVAWNTDKRYLGELAAAGAPVIPTAFVGPTDTWTPPTSGEWVVKPTVSAGSQDTGRYHLPDQQSLAVAHVARLTAAGRTAMIQPYLTAVDEAGETALLYFATPRGPLEFSHAIRKGPMLTGPDEGTIDPGSEDISPRVPSPAEQAVGDRVLRAYAGDLSRLLYARIDLIPGPDGEPLLIEFELTEPTLFLRQSEGAAARLADAIITRLQIP
ncbi:ATP-grasp domain-containing protein [Paractinoplanes rishiriensis]|uniref:ATP-grasp domain-containing protein n=1 Tax=Paractinoplanes rishiriensis TaxID=1050105 RepID=A0A919K1N8_9ACTN|nr:hypothetical protein [Actinoplanes rishiriensis]GIE97008.1 ATP-grasp domain-containing protein [Actinoplanes rishiriensis]